MIMEGPLPRYARILDFLPEHEVEQLFDWARSKRELFRPARVSTTQPRVDPEVRITLISSKLPPWQGQLRERLLAVLPQILEGTGTRGEDPTVLELQLAAHGDGAHYRPHVDTEIGTDTQDSASPVRVLSAVYYFHARPQAFFGGQLRLFGFGPVPTVQEPQPARHVDIEPVRNSLVVFPSWVPHEVRPISVPTGEFADYRFALNCWYCRTRGPASSQ